MSDNSINQAKRQQFSQILKQVFGDPLSGYSSSSYQTADIMRAYEAFYQYQQASEPKNLDAKQAQDLMNQLDHDKVLVADHSLLFGQYMGKNLRDVPLEYIVQVGAALRATRRALISELRRRRALARLSPQGGE